MKRIKLRSVGLLLGLIIMLPLANIDAAESYRSADSLLVMRLLEEGKEQGDDINLPFFFARSLVGTPYVGGTLDNSKEEELVVNLRELDCTTLVENVLALTLAERKAEPSFCDFCHYLEKVRYNNGRMNGYASRNHYFSSWIKSNVAQGYVREISTGRKGEEFPFTSVQKLSLGFMTSNAHRYPMLKNNLTEIPKIAACEKILSGEEVRYIPKSEISNLSESDGVITTGDILAVVTKVGGLDVAHVGFAVWEHGQLYLLHASSEQKKVVLDKQILSEYLKKRSSWLGVRVVRIL